MECGYRTSFEGVVSDAFERGGEYDSGEVASLERAWSDGLNAFWYKYFIDGMVEIVQRAFGDVKHGFEYVCGRNFTILV